MNFFGEKKNPKFLDPTHNFVLTKSFIFRAVNTTVCEPEDYFEKSRERWHPHRKMLPQLGQQAQYIY